MEHKATDRRLTILEVWNDPNERLLARESARFFLNRFLTPIAYRKFADQADERVFSLFRWDDYLVARCWIVGHKALSATLRLRRAFNPGDVKKS